MKRKREKERYRKIQKTKRGEVMKKREEGKEFKK